MLYAQVQQQSTTLGYLDTVYVVGIMCACMVPLVFIMKRNTGGMSQGAHRRSGLSPPVVGAVTIHSSSPLCRCEADANAKNAG